MSLIGYLCDMRVGGIENTSSFLRDTLFVHKCRFFGELHLSEFILKAGTFVKHGTSSVYLRPILENGLIPGKGRHELRLQSEATPKLNAVYVGGLAAYFAAQATHMSFMKEYVLALPDYAMKTQAYFDDANRAKDEIDIGTVTMSIPIVLNIELGKDVRLIADEDYLDIDPESKTDEQVWCKWKAGGIIEGIPSEWIKSFEFPRLVTTSDYMDRRKIVALDAELLVFGAKSVSEKVPPSLAMPPNRKESLSQTMNFTAAEIERFFSIKPMAESCNRFLSQAILASYFNQFAQKHGYTAFE